MFDFEQVKKQLSIRDQLQNKQTKKKTFKKDLNNTNVQVFSVTFDDEIICNSY